MAADVAHYLRAEWNSGPEHCVQWLWDATCRYIKQRRKDHMQDSLNKSLHNRNHNDAAPGVVPSGRGKGDRPTDNDRAASKTRSATPNRPPKGGDRGQPKGTPRGRTVDSGGKGSDDVPGKGVCWAFQKGACTRGGGVHVFSR